MTTRTVPIRNPSAHFNFDLEVNQQRLRIHLDWLTRFEYFIVKVTGTDGETLISGRGLHPQIDQFKDIDLDIGSLYLQGRPATPDNLGVENSLILET